MNTGNKRLTSCRVAAAVAGAIAACTVRAAPIEYDVACDRSPIQYQPDERVGAQFCKVFVVDEDDVRSDNHYRALTWPGAVLVVLYRVTAKDTIVQHFDHRADLENWFPEIRGRINGWQDPVRIRAGKRYRVNGFRRENAAACFSFFWGVLYQEDYYERSATGYFCDEHSDSTVEHAARDVLSRLTIGRYYVGNVFDPEKLGATEAVDESDSVDAREPEFDCPETNPIVRCAFPDGSGGHMSCRACRAQRGNIGE